MSDKARRTVLLLIFALMAAAVAALYISVEAVEADTYAAKSYVLENHVADTAAQNAVTSVYLNYRFWDTLFESLVLLISALAVIGLSWYEERIQK